MKRFLVKLNSLNFRQRYDMTVFACSVIAGGLIILFLSLATFKYTSDYTRQYWRDYAHTFAHSIKYGVILHSAAATEDVIRNFVADRNVLSASVFESPNNLLATSGNRKTECHVNATVSKQTYFLDFNTFWCFYAPLYQDKQHLGYVELVVSKHELHTFMQQILIICGLIVLAVLVLYFLLIRRFSAVFTAPMLEIVRVLHKVNQGIRGHRVNFLGAPDIEQMGTDFNDMLSKIENNEQLLEQLVTDRTHELKIALDSSRAANNYKNQIMALVSHEMKTPLHSIGAYLELIYEALPQTSEFDLCRTFYSKALVRTQDLNQLINKVLVYGKLEANKIEFSLKSIDINDLMAECATKFNLVLSKNHNQLSLSGEKLTLVSDAEILRHIVNNLLSNACKFTHNGIITLSWRQDNSDLIIQISDTGPGISADLHQQIFEPFWQADMELTREHGGHGLGLSISKRFSELLGGSITVMSKPGQGSLFIVKIPV